MKSSIIGTAVFLPQRFATRCARYLRDVQDLTMEASLEPRRWVGSAEAFWLGMAEDTAAWLRRLGYGDGRPEATFPEIRNVVLAPDQQAIEVTIEVPLAAFAMLESEKLELRPSCLESGNTVVATAGRNLRFSSPVVTIDDRFAELRVYDLPKLMSGMELRGVVWASRARDGDNGDGRRHRSGGSASATSRPVAAVCLRVS